MSTVKVYVEESDSLKRFVLKPLIGWIQKTHLPGRICRFLIRPAKNVFFF